EFAKEATNAQLWWALLAGLPICWWLRRFTRAPVFSLMFAATSALLCLATLLRLGLLDCLDRDSGRFYLDLIPCAILFMAAGFVFERLRMPDDSRYFYPFAVAHARRFALLLSIRGSLHAGRAQRRRGLSRAVGQMDGSRGAVDPRANRIPLHPERRHLFPARPHLRGLLLASGSHRGEIVPLRDSRPRDDVHSAAGVECRFAYRAARLRVALAGRRLYLRLRQHSAADEEFSC